ncbi:MAG: hypothetical protein GY868_19800 [Deltaproteobacteria bacterium]|nr:hypothetical protein [Deltaproteobacteria bacterium]
MDTQKTLTAWTIIAALIIFVLPGASMAAELTKTLTLTKSDLGTSDRLNLMIAIGGAEVTVSRSNDTSFVIQAVVTYEDDWNEPQPYLNTSENAGTVNATFGTSISYPFGSHNDHYDYWPEIQEWDITIGAYDVATDLGLAMGGAKGDLDLGGLPLESCTFTIGGANLNVDFSSPTTRQVQRITIEGGGIQLDMSNIGNTDFGTFQMIGGGNAVDLDFSGTYTAKNHDIMLIDAGSLTDIFLPPEVGAQADILSIAAFTSVRGDSWKTEYHLPFSQKYTSDDYSTSDIVIDLSQISIGSMGTLYRP